MSNPTIIATNLSKQYRLGQVGTGSLSHDINRLWHTVRGNEDPYLKIGEENKRDSKGNSEYVWALKDINFEIQQGDRVGIIGRNGAGKSTLLKILSRTTSPSTGSVKIKGKVASLLEVGTGFHPELSGKDNIFLNGAILGMSKRDIKSRFDEIVAFAGVERYIDTPVKRYSSGMYVRLAFAVAAHLESDILIVDEVLAVGDLDFQHKCLGKMGSISKGEGKTIIFVSHNMAAVQRLCNKGILLENGQVKEIAGTEKVIERYLQNSETKQSIFHIPLPSDHKHLLGYAIKLQVEDTQSSLLQDIPVGKPWQVRVFFKINEKAKHFIIALGLNSSTQISLRTSWSNPMVLEEGYYEAVFIEDQLIFSPSTYYLTLGLSNFERVVHYMENIASVSISQAIDENLDKSIIRISNVGLILNPINIQFSNSINESVDIAPEKV